MPTWMLPTVLAIAIIAGIGSVVVSRSAKSRDLVVVPNVAGLDAPVARSRLAEVALLMARGDVRFSATVPKGRVVDQRPRAGSKLPERGTVVVVVSAGSERFEMPDVIGTQIAEATTLLAEKGLSVKTAIVASSQPTGTVLASVPSPGMSVSTFDAVRLTVSSGETTAVALVAYDFGGRAFAIDASPAESGTPDAAMEVARRVQSLLQAAGADAVVSRSNVDTDVTAPTRLRRLGEVEPFAVVAMVFSSEGRIGLSVGVGTGGGSSEDRAEALRLARASVAALRGVVRTTERIDRIEHPVLDAIEAPGILVSLGNASSREDARAASDPRWADAVSRALYRALGETFAVR